MTEATPTIVARLATSANMLREVAAMHDLGNPILVEPASYVQRSLLEFEARDEITRLQSELNTALERVKVLEGKLESKGAHVIEDAERAIEIHEGVLKLKAENRTLRDTLWQFNNPPDPASLREAADEIDCGPDCERGHVEFDTGAHVCSRRDRDGCPGDLAAHLREFANAVEARAVLQSSGGK